MSIFRESMLGLFLIAACGGCNQRKLPVQEWVDMNATLPETLLSPVGESISRNMLRGKFVGLYFSASWCPPCRAFTPRLIKFRNERAKEFEVVLIGLDKSAQKQQEYVVTAGMPWPALHHQGEHSKKLQDMFGVRSLPTLIVISPEGLVVSIRGREEIEESGSAIFEDWLAKTKGS